MLTDRQVTYQSVKGEKYRSRHTYMPAHTIGMGLALRSYKCATLLSHYNTSCMSQMGNIDC